MSSSLLELPKLPPRERIARYRELADEAEYLSRAGHTAEMRRAYMTMAAEWRTLAEELEKAVKKLEADNT